jgi:hypothetical protein
MSYNQIDLTSGGMLSSTKNNSPEQSGARDGARVSIDATHSHNFSCSTVAGGGAHTHTISGSITGASITGSTADTGSGNAFTVDTVPVYYTVIYIIKAA